MMANLLINAAKYALAPAMRRILGVRCHDDQLYLAVRKKALNGWEIQYPEIEQCLQAFTEHKILDFMGTSKN